MSRWVDADSILLNPALSPALFLAPEASEQVFARVTANHNGLNNGLFYLCIHQRALDLLTQTIDYPLAHPDEDLGWSAGQAAMANVISSIETQTELDGGPSGIVWVPREWFNTYQFEHGFEGQPGHFVVHFAGLGGTRITHMASWLEELEVHQARWEIPLESTFYKTAVPEFWAQVAASATGPKQVNKELACRRPELTACLDVGRVRCLVFLTTTSSAPAEWGRISSELYVFCGKRPRTSGVSSLHDIHNTDQVHQAAGILAHPFGSSTGSRYPATSDTSQVCPLY